jgi:pimeloyl-ACP methyl ester carboxylesterase
VGFHVRRTGSGPPVVLVHGSIQNSVTWVRQLPLAREFTLVLPDRPGYPPNPPLSSNDSIDFEQQADEMAGLLDGGAHVAGFSYGGVIALLAAARRPDAVWSLTVIEPPCLGIARGDPVVDATVAAYEPLYALDDPAEFVAGFSAAFGPEGRVPATIRPGDEQGVQALMAERRPWEADIPLGELAAAGFPVLVCSSGGHPAYEAVCDVLERALAAERAVLPGAGHAVQFAPGFNARFADFLRRAS